MDVYNKFPFRTFAISVGKKLIAFYLICCSVHCFELCLLEALKLNHAENKEEAEPIKCK